MAKRQRTLQAVMFRAGRMDDDNDEASSAQTSQLAVSNSRKEKSKLEIARENWKDSWYILFD